MKRRTIGGPITLEGIGLHLGHSVKLTFRPGKPGAGLMFRRTDLDGAPTIPANADSAVLTDRRTQIGTDPTSVHTVEHVLAAVAGLEIDDLEIDVDAPESPI